MKWRKEEVIEKLKKDQGARSLRNYAETVFGCSPGYLSDVYNGKRDPGQTLLDHLNLEPVTIYVQKKDRRWR